MLVTPRPGVHRDNLLEQLRSAHTSAFNLRGGGAGTAYDRLLDYLNWVSDTVATLGSQISSADLDRLVLTRRYEQLLSGVGTLAGTDLQRLVNGLVHLELRERVDAFEDAINSLNRHIARWSRSDYFVAVDSSFYIRHPEKLEEVDFADLLGFHNGPIHLLVPMVIVDELDNLKQAKGDQQARWRSGYTLAVFDRLFKDGNDVGRLLDADAEKYRTTGTRDGEVNVEILLDPPTRVRLPINDEEMIDRLAAIKPLVSRVGRNVTLLTYDTNQASRGRRAGLNVIKLTTPLGEEPK